MPPRRSILPRFPQGLAAPGPVACAALAALSLVAGAAPGLARAEDPTRRGFDADPHRLALSLDVGFAAETAGVAERGAWGLGALLELSNGLLTLRQGDRRDDLLESRLALHLLGGWSLGTAELSAQLPVALVQRSDLSLLTSQGVTGPLVDPIARTALGDLRLGAKLAIADPGAAAVGLALLLDLRLPTGDRQAFTGDGFAFVPSLVATHQAGRLRVDGQLGYAFRGRGQYAQLVVQDGWVGVLGGSLALPPLGALARWRAIAELTGGVPRGFDLDSDRSRSALSARAGVRAFLGPSLSVEVGGGTGLGASGYGHERWRVFLGARWAGRPRPPAPGGDRDGDGVPDPADRCPDVPGNPALDGCPDQDGDEIPDIEDDCPKVPGPAARRGCPVAEDEPLVELQTERISLNDAITFDTDRDTIKPASFPVLDQVARLLLAHPELTHVRVEGHTDNVGAAAYNKGLSARRAASVVRYLVGKGVGPGRLLSAGYGFDRPVATNATALGRARNRRVEFTLLPGGAAPGTP